MHDFAEDLLFHRFCLGCHALGFGLGSRFFGLSFLGLNFLRFNFFGFNLPCFLHFLRLGLRLLGLFLGALGLGRHRKGGIGFLFYSALLDCK